MQRPGAVGVQKKQGRQPGAAAVRSKGESGRRRAQRDICMDPLNPYGTYFCPHFPDWETEA